MFSFYLRAFIFITADIKCLHILSLARANTLCVLRLLCYVLRLARYVFNGAGQTYIAGRCKPFSYNFV